MNNDNTKDDDIVSRTAIEIVTQVRRLHFQEGNSQVARTKRLKEIVEKNSKEIFLNAS